MAIIALVACLVAILHTILQLQGQYFTQNYLLIFSFTHLFRFRKGGGGGGGHAFGVFLALRHSNEKLWKFIGRKKEQTNPCHNCILYRWPIRRTFKWIMSAVFMAFVCWIAVILFVFVRYSFFGQWNAPVGKVVIQKSNHCFCAWWKPFWYVDLHNIGIVSTNAR